ASLNSLNDAVVAYMQFDGTHVLIQGAEATINGILPNLFWTQATTISSSSNNTAPRIASTYATNHLYAACSWIDSNSGYNVLQASVGSRSTLAPPTSLSVQQTSTSYGVFTDYYNTLTWSASSDASVIGYAIFRNDELIGTVAASTLTYVEHNTVQNGSVTYTVTAFDFNLMQSASATASFP
ncbi:MAG: hypothetical protein KGQ49_04630, partial [Verrucomicrobia bacterium]|nr:hypothetical protein [Verrucomicrobiota bacterium]